MNGLVCVTGTKGAPGTTTLSLALAAVFADRYSSVLLDADPDGGTLAARCGLPASPGLVSLAADARHALEPSAIGRHTQLLQPRLELIAAPPSSGQIQGALRTLGSGFAQIMTTDRTIVDIGRLRPGSPSVPFVTAASLTVLVVSPTVDGVAHARDQLGQLETLGARTSVAVAAGGYPPSEVAAALEVDHAIALPLDRRAALSLPGAGRLDRWLRRTALVRTVVDLADQLDQDVEVAA